MISSFLFFFKDFVRENKIYLVQPGLKVLDVGDGSAKIDFPEGEHLAI